MSVDITYADNILTATRLYDASREKVFEAWIETSKLELWWGCADTTKVCSEVEPKVGGKYIQMMTIKNAGEYPGGGVITEFDPPSVLAFVAEDTPSGAKNMVRVTFEDKDGQTLVTLKHHNLPAELKDIVRGGWTSALERLSDLLAGKPMERAAA